MTTELEVFQEQDAFMLQMTVDEDKKTISAQQIVDYLTAHWNGLYTAGIIDNTGITEAGTLWTTLISWFTVAGYPAVSIIMNDIGGGGGWTTYPLNSAP